MTVWVLLYIFTLTPGHVDKETFPAKSLCETRRVALREAKGVPTPPSGLPPHLAALGECVEARLVVKP